MNSWLSEQLLPGNWITVEENSYFLVALGLFNFCKYCTYIGRVVSGALATTAFDCDLIACSLESIRQSLVQGCKTPNGVGKACLITSSKLGQPYTEHGLYALSQPPLGIKLATTQLGLVELYHHY